MFDTSRMGLNSFINHGYTPLGQRDESTLKEKNINLVELSGNDSRQTPLNKRSGQLFSPIRNPQSIYKGLKVPQLDLDDLVMESDIDDESLPKYKRIDLKVIYRVTGLPKPPLRSNEVEKGFFMAQNLLRVYKRLLIQILENYLEEYKKNNEKQMNDSASVISITKREGVSAILDAINYVKLNPPLKPLYWNKLLS